MSIQQKQNVLVYVFIAIILYKCSVISLGELLENMCVEEAFKLAQDQEQICNTSNLLESTDPEDVEFYLYPNAENTTDNDLIKIRDRMSLIKSRYNSTNPPVFVIHGFLNNYSTRYTQRMKNAFLEHNISSSFNIIAVNWGKLATPSNITAWFLLHQLSSDNIYYHAAVKNVPKVAYRVAEFISFLIEEKQLDSPAGVYLCGFSLGAQISGYVGSVIKFNYSIPVGRITGFDPAGPLYQHETASNRLDATDATFVDVYHSNQGQDGYYGNTATADFYPNGGGPHQPDCIKIEPNTVAQAITGSCAHNRAWMYYIFAFTKNITACQCYSQADLFCRFRCTNKATVGYYCQTTAKGSYYFDVYYRDPNNFQYDDQIL